MSQSAVSGLGMMELAVFACVVIVPLVGLIALLVVLNRRK